MDSEQRLTDHELVDFFDQLFLDGFSSTDILKEVAPEGWQNSPLRASVHPSSEMNVIEEVADLVGHCLWDIFSNNHEVIAADSRAVDIGSFRSASAFLDGYLSKEEAPWEGDYMRFYMGTGWLGGHADFRVVYKIIFQRLKALGADWAYRFPQMQMLDLSSLYEKEKSPTQYSPSEALL